MGLDFGEDAVEGPRIEQGLALQFAGQVVSVLPNHQALLGMVEHHFCSFGRGIRPGAKRFSGSKADLRRRMRGKPGRGGPQMLTWRFSCVGHKGRVAEAFSLAQREKTALAACARSWTDAASFDVGSKAK